MAKTDTNHRWAISINGKIDHEESSKISVLDRGFLYGDSIYEVTTTFKNAVMFWPDHFTRLNHSAHGIGFQLNLNEDQLFSEIVKTVHAGKLEEAYIRIVVTRGQFDEMALFQTESTKGKNNVVIFVQPLPQPPDHYIDPGISLYIAKKTVRNSPDATNPNFKTGNYLNSILAINEAKKAGFDDAVLLNALGHVTEGTTFNIWGIKNGEAYTTPLESGILLGITRKHLITLLKTEGITLKEETLTADALLKMDEVFVTSSVKNILPVAKINDVEFPASMREITPMLREKFQAFAREHAEHSMFVIP